MVHAHDIFAVVEKKRGYQFGRDLNHMLPVKNVEELRWYSRCFYERDCAKGVLTTFQQAFAEQLAYEYGVEYGSGVAMLVSTKCRIFDTDETSGGLPFLRLVGSQMLLSTQTRPGIFNAVRAMARYCAAPKFVYWRAALGSLAYLMMTSSLGIPFQRGTVTGLSMQVFDDADYARKAADSGSVREGW